MYFIYNWLEKNFNVGIKIYAKFLNLKLMHNRINMPKAK